MITTDNKNPVFSFYVESDVNNTYIEKAILTIGNHKIEVKDQRSIKYDGPALLPFTEYEAHLEVVDNYNNKSEKIISFSTGFLDSKWSGKWISDSKYVFKTYNFSCCNK
jgi:alpha-L-rhamnosidase